jgi:folate-binding protein YgfZ
MVRLLSLMKIPESISIHRYAPAAVLRATGPDARTFLQGQFTNDLSKIGPGESAYGLWLDRKGRVMADSRVVQGDGVSEFWIVSTFSPAAAIGSHLGAHLIADDVEIADETAAWRGISLVGAGSGGWLASERRPGLSFPGRRDAGEGWEWIVREQDLAAAVAAVSGARELSADEVERLRIASGIPSVPADVGPSDLPNEAGLDRVAISYSKGCYTGQEVMARIRSMGRLRRELVRVRGGGPLPRLPAALWRGDRREGELRSAVGDAGGFHGLALVSASSASAGVALALAVGSHPTVEITGAL